MAGVEFSFYVLFIAFFLSGKINNLQFHSCTRSLSYNRALLHYLQFYLEWKKNYTKQIITLLILMIQLLPQISVHDLPQTSIQQMILLLLIQISMQVCKSMYVGRQVLSRWEIFPIQICEASVASSYQPTSASIRVKGKY